MAQQQWSAITTTPPPPPAESFDAWVQQPFFAEEQPESEAIASGMPWMPRPEPPPPAASNSDDDDDDAPQFRSALPAAVAGVMQAGVDQAAPAAAAAATPAAATEREPPPDLVDPLTGALMTDPVQLPSSGVTVDRSTIERHFAQCDADSKPWTDPFTREEFTPDPAAAAALTADDAVRERVIAWQVAERWYVGVAAGQASASGELATLRGLQSAPQLNDQTVMLQRFDHEKGRWVVVLQAPEHGGKEVRVKPVNLQRLAAVDGDEGK
jgi:hypothetical protein